MLKIFNELEPFFNDNYRRISVREYARMTNISPPSASSLLNKMHAEGLLIKEEEKKYLFFAANKESSLFIQLCRSYWYIQLKKSGLMGYLQKELVNPLIILFGSLSRAETTPTSDIDLAIIKSKAKKLELGHFEQKMRRRIQIMFFDGLDHKDKKELKINVLNGFVLAGGW